MGDIEQAYREQLEKFSRTIEAKSNHKREVIINRIRESLRPEYQALVKIERMEITAENGTVIRSLLRKVFAKLEREGVNYKEERK